MGSRECKRIFEIQEYIRCYEKKRGHKFHFVSMEIALKDFKNYCKEKKIKRRINMQDFIKALNYFNPIRYSENSFYCGLDGCRRRWIPAYYKKDYYLYIYGYVFENAIEYRKREKPDIERFLISEMECVTDYA